MLSRSILVAFLTLALSVQALPQGQDNRQACPAARTVTQVSTVTVTARGAVPAAPTLVVNGGNGGQISGINNNNGGKDTNNNNGGKGTKTSAVAATATQRGNGGGKNNNGSSTSSAAAAATAVAGNTGGKNGGKNNGDLQKSTTLDPRVIAPGFANNGQDVPTAGQVASLTSKNNFINFCLTVPNLPITNGKQVATGSCNPAPIGVIPSSDNMPSSKFVFPPNFGTIKAGQTFTIQMAIKNMQTGFFVNAQANYFSAPQQLNKQGQIQGHSHVVVEQLSAIDQTTPTDPKKFAFFKGLNAAAQGGKLTADVPDGLQPGFYKLSSINTASNHQPVIVPIAQHGSLDDAIYFSVTADGKPVAGAAGGKNAPPAAGTSKAAPAASPAVSAPAPAKASATGVAKGVPPAKGAATPAGGKPAPAASATNAPSTGNNNAGSKPTVNTGSNTANNSDNKTTTNTANNTDKKNVGNVPAPAASSAVPEAPQKGGRQRRGLNRLA